MGDFDEVTKIKAELTPEECKEYLMDLRSNG